MRNAEINTEAAIVFNCEGHTFTTHERLGALSTMALFLDDAEDQVAAESARGFVRSYFRNEITLNGFAEAMTRLRNSFERLGRPNGVLECDRILSGNMAESVVFNSCMSWAEKHPLFFEERYETIANIMLMIVGLMAVSIYTA